MKSTGIVRKVDNLGRIVLPKELRETLQIDIQDPLAVYVEDNMVILKKYNPACILCGETQYTFNYQGKNICSNCLEELYVLIS
jgi:transcriptional pleiotropic regulator of transition state genes